MLTHRLPLAHAGALAVAIPALAAQLFVLAGDAGGGPPVEVTGPRHVLPAGFDVTGLATATVGAASAAVAELVAVRTGTDAPPATVDTRGVSAAFRSEQLFAP